jgi:cytidine deaminase
MMQKKMLEKALETMKHAYAPYSQFKVGACLKTKDGQLFSGCNIENISFGLTLCAEAAAIANMFTCVGEQEIQEVVIVSSGDGIATPCGACRQRFAEFGSPETKLYFYDLEQHALVLTLDELLPYAFSSIK